MFINIKISSKNKNSLQNFLKIFNRFCKKKKFKANYLIKYYSKQRQINIFTILKSPHVNKKAQEQFEYRLFSKQINIFSFQMLKFVILVKQINTKLCSDVKMNIKLIFNKNKTKKIQIKTLNPANFNLSFFQNKKLNKTQNQIKLYLKLLDIYGEIYFRTILVSNGRPL